MIDFDGNQLIRGELIMKNGELKIENWLKKSLLAGHEGYNSKKEEKIS